MIPRAVVVRDDRLAAIAGAPLVDWQTAGTATQVLNLPGGVDPLSGRTIYTVLDVASLYSPVPPNGTAWSIAEYANINTPILRFNVEGNGTSIPLSWLVEARNSGGKMANAAVGLSCHTYGCLPGATSVKIWSDTSWGTRITGADITGLPHNRLSHYSPAATYAAMRTKGLRTVVFAGVHSPDTAKRIRAWLLRSTVLS